MGFPSRMLGAFQVLTLILSIGNGADIIKPTSSIDLQRALDRANPGDTIQMLPMVYNGNFVISNNGVTLTGDRNSTIESEGVGLHVKGSDWKLKAFSIKGPTKGALIEGQNNLLDGVVLQKTGQAIVVRGSENTVKGCVISEADLGIILETSNHKLLYNSVNIQTPAIIIPKDSCCNFLDGNVANGQVNVEGSGNKLNGNVCNHGLYITGCDNELSGNVANGASFPTSCKWIDNSGNVFRGTGPGDTDPVPMNMNSNTNQFGGYYNPGHIHGSSGQKQGQNNGVPVQVSGNGPAPKCSCSCTY